MHESTFNTNVKLKMRVGVTVTPQLNDIKTTRVVHAECVNRAFIMYESTLHSIWDWMIREDKKGFRRLRGERVKKDMLEREKRLKIFYYVVDIFLSVL